MFPIICNYSEKFKTYDVHLIFAASHLFLIIFIFIDWINDIVSKSSCNNIGDNWNFTISFISSCTCASILFLLSSHKLFLKENNNELIKPIVQDQV